MTRVDYGRHRRRLEKWAEALGIDGVVSFADGRTAGEIDPANHDVAILGARQPGALVHIVRALLGGRCVLAGDGNTAAAALLGDGALGMLFPPKDVPALSQAMLTVAEPDRSLVRERLGPDAARDASTGRSPLP